MARMIWTTAGYAAIVNAQNNGTAPVLCAQIAVGTGTTAATKDDTALESEVKRIDTIAGQAVDANIIHVVLRDESSDAYTVNEIGLIADDGTLLARYAQTDAIIEKAAGSTALLPIDATFTDVDATQITFPSTDFVNPPWSETVKGVSKRATQALAEAGSDNTTGMSPLRVFQAIAKWLGVSAPANTYPISITGRAAVADDADHASQADNASNASQLGGNMPSDYRRADKLTGIVPAARMQGTYSINISGNAASAGNSNELGGNGPGFYQNASNLSSGTVPSGRLSGTYGISITGRAAVADDADHASQADNASNASQLGGNMPSDYRRADKLTGTVPTSTLNGNRDITGEWTLGGINVYLGSAINGTYGVEGNVPNGFSMMRVLGEAGYPTTDVATLFTHKSSYNRTAVQDLTEAGDRGARRWYRSFNNGDNNNSGWIEYVTTQNFISKLSVLFSTSRDVTSSYTDGDTRYNTTGKPMLVTVGSSTNDGQLELTINGEQADFASNGGNSGVAKSVQGIVPVNGNYSASTNGSSSSIQRVKERY